MRSLFFAFAVITCVTAAPIVSAHADQHGKKIAYFGTAAGHPFIAGQYKAVVAKAKSLGMEVTGFFSPFDAALQAQQVDDAIARKFDAILMVAVSEHAIVPSLERAKTAGIPVILVTGTMQGHDDLYLTFVGDNPVELGKMAGEAVVRGLKASGRDGGNVALITGSLEDGVAPLRIQGFKEAIAANTKIKIVAIEDAKWDTALSEKAAGQIFARFSGQGGIDAIYGMADNQAVAAVAAAESAGIKVGDGPHEVLVVGGSCQKQGIEDIKAGTIYATFNQVPGTEGETAVQVAADYFNGKMPPRAIYIPVEAVTKANLDKWAAPCSY
jgi:ABC-type sugar transport system substrate-binding protein